MTWPVNIRPFRDGDLLEIGIDMPSIARAPAQLSDAFTAVCEQTGRALGCLGVHSPDKASKFARVWAQAGANIPARYWGYLLTMSRIILNQYDDYILIAHGATDEQVRTLHRVGFVRKHGTTFMRVCG